VAASCPKRGGPGCGTGWRPGGGGPLNGGGGGAASAEGTAATTATASHGTAGSHAHAACTAPVHNQWKCAMQAIYLISDIRNLQVVKNKKQANGGNFEFKLVPVI
jgi:hypothetical protein